MSITVSLPTILRPYVNDQRRVQIEGATLGSLIDNLDAAYPGIKNRIVEDGGIRRYVNVYINSEDVRFLNGVDSQLADGDEIDILPAVAGG
jgi:molybdopterin synthase sulfur carrier subunit